MKVHLAKEMFVVEYLFAAEACLMQIVLGFSMRLIDDNNRVQPKTTAKKYFF